MTAKLLYQNFKKKLYRTKYFKKRYKNVKYFLFLNTNSKIQSKNLLSNQNESEIDIVTIAFNNPLIIEYQINLLRKNIADKFTHIIADNSNDFNIRKSIFEVCNRLGVLYVSIPLHNYSRNDSHAVAMHWTYKSVIRKRNNKYFGFLDHDIFPIKPCSIIKSFKNDIYGRVTPPYGPSGEILPVTINQPYWSLWAGFLFLKSELVNDIDVYKLDFFIKVTDKGQLDTGGGLWDTILKKIPFPGELAKFSYVKFRHSEDSNIHTDYYECLDDWIHVGNLSNWYETPDFQEKIDYFENWLREIIYH